MPPKAMRSPTFVGILALAMLAAGCATDMRHDGRVSQEQLLRAEAKADSNGRAILAKGREMTFERGEVLPGSCWDFSNAVFNRAGFPPTRRYQAFEGTKGNGPFAPARKIRGGDWLYFKNHSYGGVEHSAIFVDWIDKGAKRALMLSYGGENRREPARYRPYDLSDVYVIVRAGRG